MTKKVLLPLPAFGFDPTEVAIPWKLLSNEGIEVIFTTPNAERAVVDKRMLLGDNLGIWKPVLMARDDAVLAHHQMIESPAFVHPISYSEIEPDDFDGILLPGGHDKPVREYLESEALQSVVVDFFNKDKPVAAVCHGVVLAARSIDKQTGRSVLYPRKTTCLLKSQEMTAYQMTRLWLKDYYLTYPDLTVEDEVTAALSSPENFSTGPQPLFRDDLQHLERGFVVKDGNYISARWPGDIYSFTLAFIDVLLTDKMNQPDNC